MPRWQIVINHASGHGTPPHPDSNYIAGISQLDKYGNVKTLWYVHTAEANRAYNTVTSDIDVSTNWASYPSVKSPQRVCSSTMQRPVQLTPIIPTCGISSYAYSKVPSDMTPVIFNPGTLAPTRHNSCRDTMVEFESYFVNYANQTTINILPSAYLGQSAILIHNQHNATSECAELKER